MITDAYMCYAPSEKHIAEDVAAALAGLETRDLLALRWDRDATAGSRFSDTVRNRIDEADIVLLLISKAFLASNFCQDEMNHAIDRDLVVIPIVLESCDWLRTAARRPEFLPSDSNPVSSWKNRADALADIANGVAAACEQYAQRIQRLTDELSEEERAILARLYPNERLDGLELWDTKRAARASYIPTFMELLSEKKYIDRDFAFSVAFPFWRQRFWLTKRGRRVVARYLKRESAPPSSA